LIDGFNNLQKARDKGINFNGAKYECVRADTKSIYGKKVFSNVLASLLSIYFRRENQVS
jgi:hypothetical protein